MSNWWRGIGTGSLVRVQSLGIDAWGTVTDLTIDPAEAYGQPEPTERGVRYRVAIPNGKVLRDVRPDEIIEVDMDDPEQLDEWLRHG